MIRVLSFECIGNPNDNDITIDEAVISLFVCMYHSESVLDVCVTNRVLSTRKKKGKPESYEKKKGAI